jgi:hypothetical protein
MPTQDAARFVDVLVLGLDSSGWDAISAVGSVNLLVGGGTTIRRIALLELLDPRSQLSEKFSD